MISSDLSEQELHIRFPEEIAGLTPYVYITKDQYTPFREFNNNERKFRRRTQETQDLYAFEDGETERYHAELVVYPKDPFEYDDLYEAIALLTPAQRERIMKQYFEEMTLQDVAAAEKVSFQAIAKCNAGAIKALKKLLS